MEKYLGYKGQAARRGDMPLLGVLGFMLVIVFMAIPPEDYLSDGISFLAFVIVAGAFALPFWLTLSHRFLWKDARAAAKVLAVHDGPTMPLQRLGELANVKRPEKRVPKLIDKGYLANVQHDPAHNAVLLTTWEPPVRAAVPKRTAPAPVALRCPHCGGTTRAIPGQPAQCQWCDSALDNPEK